LEFPGGWGFYKTKKFKEMYEAQSEFPEGSEGLPWGRYGYFLELHILFLNISLGLGGAISKWTPTQKYYTAQIQELVQGLHAACMVP